jgi:hypothetical protein
MAGYARRFGGKTPRLKRKAMQLIVLFNLKAGVAEADYEAWAKSVDLATVRRLPTVKSFNVFRSSGVFGSDKKPSYRYVEMLDVPNLNALVADIQAGKLGDVPQQFGTFAEAPEFMMCDSIEG